MSEVKASKPLLRLAEKFRGIAQRLVTDITIKRRYRETNTPKRQKQAAADTIDANHLDRVRVAAVKIAEALESMTLPPYLSGISTKSMLLNMLRTRVDCSGGYYSIRDTGEYYDQSPAAVKLRAWLEGKRTDAEVAAAEARGRLERIKQMEEAVRFSGIAGFFPTPPSVVVELCNAAGLFTGCRVLEPSAGKGDILDHIRDLSGTCPGIVTDCYEVNHSLRDILAAKGYTPAAEPNFLAAEPNPVYDRVVMNPPFEGGQDVDHVRHAFQFLKPGGSLVAVMSAAVKSSSRSPYPGFRDWVADVGGSISDLPPNSFRGGFVPVGVSCVMVVIDRPA